MGKRKTIQIIFFIMILVSQINLNCKKKESNTDLLIGLWLLSQFQIPVCDATPLDKYFPNQWHLKNTGQGGGTSGEDGNVIPVWESGNWGYGSIIAIVDDGIDIDHPDISPNVLRDKNYEYILGTNDLSIAYSYAEHGTSVSGVSAGRCNNEGVRGVAPLASLVGYNLLLSPTTSNSADAMTRNKEIIHISNNSWGATDGLGSLDDSLAHTSWKNAIIDGINNGNHGKGIFYAWAAGNGRKGNVNPTIGIPTDDSNYDGQANFYGVNAICAVTFKGKQSWYSERGANLLVCAPSNGASGELAITTTDIRGSYGYTTDDYTSDFGGTSSATPYVSGVVALMLSANPYLTWRDIRYILATTARQVDPTDSGWFTNGGGRKYNHKYGFGVVNASDAVNTAKTFSTLGGSSSLQTCQSTSSTSATITISGCSITKIEFVEVNVNFTTSDFGNMTLTLTSPAGTQAKLVEPHYTYDTSSNPYTYSYTNKNWRFGVTAFLDESTNGNYTLSITNGTGNSWYIKIYGR